MKCDWNFKKTDSSTICVVGTDIKILYNENDMPSYSVFYNQHLECQSYSLDSAILAAEDLANSLVVLGFISEPD